MWPRVSNIWPKLGQMWLKLGQHRPTSDKFGQCWSKLAQTWPNLANARTNIAEFGPNLVSQSNFRADGGQLRSSLGSPGVSSRDLWRPQLSGRILLAITGLYKGLRRCKVRIPPEIDGTSSSGHGCRFGKCRACAAGQVLDLKNPQSRQRPWSLRCPRLWGLSRATFRTTPLRSAVPPVDLTPPDSAERSATTTTSSVETGAPRIARLAVGALTLYAISKFHTSPHDRKAPVEQSCPVG